MHILDALREAVSTLIAGITAMAVLLGISPIQPPSTVQQPEIAPIERPLEESDQKLEENESQATPKAVEEAPPPGEEVPVAPVVEPTAPSLTPTEANELEAPAGELTSVPLSFTEINTTTRGALVNIVCSTSAGSPLNGVSGSGVIVSSDGVVLTNAHVAQYYLLLGQPSLGSITCTLRTGAPAKNTYRAELVYLPPQWVSTNAVKITQAAPTGTGEHDFALLRITERVDGSPVGETPFVAINVTEPELNEPVLLAGYAAGFLGSNLINRDLSITSAITTVRKLFTFGSGSIDLIDVSGTIVSQKGSSGGAVVDARNLLRALVVTSSQDENTSDRELHAVTLAHADRVLRGATNQTLPQFIASAASNGLSYRSSTMPPLSLLLTAAITK